ncbi:MAG: hypothetical protein HKN25_02180 [Pyrinomonadaceae bacterium]|nr:hypothetical protein [Pyrinomonadaceae bacterium]
MADEKVHEYSSDEITVIWKPDICIHSAECVKGLPHVFKPKDNPWVQIEKATPEEIREAIDRCPSGALSYRVENPETPEPEDSNRIRVKATKNGPFIISGDVEIEDRDGNVRPCPGKTTALCRCGASRNKPFCDGSHTGVKFFG